MQSICNAGKTWRIILVLPCFVSLVAGAAGGSAAAPPQDGEKKDARARLALRGMLDARERFTSGVAQIAGRKVSGPLNSQVDRKSAKIDAPFHGLYAFDDSGRLLRFNATEPTYVRNVNAASLRGKDPAAIRAAIDAVVPIRWDTKLRYVRNHEYMAWWTEAGPSTRSSVAVLAPDASMGGGVARNHHLFDLRACGVIDIIQFESGPMERGVGIADACQRLLDASVSAVSRDGDIIAITLKSKLATHKLRINEKNGYSVIEHASQSLRDPGSFASHVRWEERSSTWVPASFSIEMRAPQLDRFERYEYEFVWTNVNEPVDRSYFDYKSFPDVWDDVPVVDLRKKDLPTIGVWKNGKFTEAVVATVVPDVGKAVPSPLRPRRGMGWLMVGNITFLLVLAAFVWFRWRQEKK